MRDHDNLVETRRENIRAIARELVGQKELADVLGKDESFISQLIGKGATKTIGEKLAREVEKKAGKPHLWLDRAHGINERLLETVMEAIDSEFGADPLPPDQRRRLISLLYALYAEDGVRLDRIRDVVALVQDARKG